jgi:hypothetical protein
MDCRLCGAKNIQASYSGADICPACDCYGCCKRCKILIEENRILKEELQKLTGATE